MREQCWNAEHSQWSLIIFIFILPPREAAHWFIYFCLQWGWAPSLTSLMVILRGTERSSKFHIAIKVRCGKKTKQNCEMWQKKNPPGVRTQWVSSWCIALHRVTILAVVFFKTPFIPLWTRLGEAWLDKPACDVWKTTESIKQSCELSSFSHSTNNNSVYPLFLVTCPNFLHRLINFLHMVLRNIPSILTWRKIEGFALP